MQERKQIGILLIATNRYGQFVQPLIYGIEKNFLPNDNITIHLFTDEPLIKYETDRTIVETYSIPAYKFPSATLLRYKIFSDHYQDLIKYNYLFYLDVDMDVVSEVGDEIIGEGLTAVSHPGYFMNNGWGSPNCNPNSTAFTPIEKRKYYCAGGFQGGETEQYLDMCKVLSNNIEIDEQNNILAEWHDETHWNWFLNEVLNGNGFIRLRPDYCMVEQKHLRKLWGIDNLQPKIIALAKDHKELRK